jgi:Rod binding domain-containing protein
MIDAISGLASRDIHGAAQRPQDSPERVREAASQFESLLIAQLLRSAREAGSAGGWLGSGEDASAESGMQLAEEQFARAIAEGGGLGLAKLIAEGLQR